jgi:hypothetical protein
LALLLRILEVTCASLGHQVTHPDPEFHGYIFRTMDIWKNKEIVWKIVAGILQQMANV